MTVYHPPRLIRRIRTDLLVWIRVWIKVWIRTWIRPFVRPIKVGCPSAAWFLMKRTAKIYVKLFLKICFSQPYRPKRVTCQRESALNFCRSSHLTECAIAAAPLSTHAGSNSTGPEEVCSVCSLSKIDFPTLNN